jgi:aldose 1-epimerase
MQNNRRATYPIHGDGYALTLCNNRRHPGHDAALAGFPGNPYDYEAVQTFRLVDGGLTTRRCLARSRCPAASRTLVSGISATRIGAPVQKFGLGDDPMPVAHASPPG